ncbi:MAG: PSP1 C-terminal domain-containing protein [Pirellulales bacterium]
MSRQHLVRVGAMGHVGRYVSSDATVFPRHARVIVRTRRGVEIGEILTAPEATGDEGQPDGAILRGMTTEDFLLEARLEKNRHRAFEACIDRLAEFDVDATLVDVEHLFDGSSLIFYFLGDVVPSVEQITTELAETYEATVKFRSFTDAVVNGCGPDCGTNDAAGGCDSCISCSLSGSCK